jgi:hypothetical protein
MVHDVAYCMDNADAVRLYRSARSSLNLYRKEASATADGWAMGPREVELAATNTFFVREPRGESDEVLHMLPTFRSAGELREVLCWWLGHDKQREAAAASARSAIAERTFVANATQLLTALQ